MAWHLVTRDEFKERLRRLGVESARYAQVVAARYRGDRLPRVAEALSYTTTLSIVPLTTVAFGLFAVFPVFEKWMATIQAFLYSHFLPTSGDVVQRYLQDFASKSASLTAVGLLFLILTALMLMATIEQTFNDIWRVTQSRRPLHRFLSYWAILTLGPLLLGVSLSVTSYLVSLPFFGSGGVRSAVVEALPVLTQVAAIFLLYTIVPNARVKWQHALIGSLAAAALFEVAKNGFAYFVVNYSSYNAIYGAIAALPVFLIWVYVSWLIVLLGAVLVATMPQWGEIDPQEVEAEKREADALAQSLHAPRGPGH